PRDHLDAARALEPVAEAGGQRARLDERAVHLPVADDEWCAHQLSVSASTPGSLRPSRNSKNAPPADVGRGAALDERAVPLPVADDEWCAHQLSVSASTPGSLRPSRNSRNAPPA